MNRRVAFAFTVVVALFGTSVGTAFAHPSTNSSGSATYLDAKGHAKRAKPAKPGRGGSANLSWHGGPILHGVGVHPIYWGAKWSNSTFVGDKVTGLDTFYSGMGGSPYAGSNIEYSGSNGQVTSAVSFVGDATDLSAAPQSAPATNAILNEVKKLYPNPVAGDYYPVYIDGRRGNAGYCAWHTAGTINGTVVEFAFFFNLDGDPGCDPTDTWTTHSQGLAALANVTGHELSETMTDPQINAWYDSSGAENADKCAWTFHKVSNFGNGSSWKIQGNWSNYAYNHNSGYTKGGCIDGN